MQRADAGFTHKIDYQIGSTHGAVCGKTGETRVTWMPPLSLAEEITDAVAGDCVLTATTYSGQQRGGDQLLHNKAVCAGGGEAHRQSGGPGGE